MIGLALVSWSAVNPTWFFSRVNRALAFVSGETVRFLPVSSALAEAAGEAAGSVVFFGAAEAVPMAAEIKITGIVRRREFIFIQPNKHALLIEVARKMKGATLAKVAAREFHAKSAKVFAKVAEVCRNGLGQALVILGSYIQGLFLEPVSSLSFRAGVRVIA
jgi:hypothetical protein